MVVDVRRSMRLQHAPISRAEEPGITDLDRIGVAPGQATDKVLQASKKLLCLNSRPLKLKGKGTGMPRESLLTGWQHGVPNERLI